MYKAYCKNEAVRSMGHYEDTFEFFGDVHATSFKVWWKNYGINAFREPDWLNQFKVIKSTELQHYANPDYDHYVFLMLPLQNHSKKELKIAFNKFLRASHTSKVGQRLSNKSKAWFSVTGRPKISALKRLILLNDFYQENQLLPQWRIALDSGLFPVSSKELANGIDTALKNQLSARVSRDLKKIDCLLHNVAMGRFPDYSENKLPT